MSEHRGQPEGVLHVTGPFCAFLSAPAVSDPLHSAVEARNLAAMDKGGTKHMFCLCAAVSAVKLTRLIWFTGTSDPYVVVKSTFNKQTFKTKYVIIIFYNCISWDTRMRACLCCGFQLRRLTCPPLQHREEDYRPTVESAIFLVRSFFIALLC